MTRKIILIDPNRTFAGKPIGNYNPNNDAFNKRKPNPDPLPDLKGKIDWSKLDLSKVFTMATKENGLTMWDAIERADNAAYIIIPNQVHDRMLVELDFFKTPGIEEGYATRTGTLVIYTKPDTPFSNALTYSWEDSSSKTTYSINVDIPEKFIGKVNSALVIEHPDFDIIQLENNSYEIKAKEEKLFLLENFPKENGNYKYDEQFRIPIGKKLEDLDNTTRYLRRVVGDYIGSACRGYYGFNGFGDGGQNVFLGYRPSGGRGVHVIKKEDIPFSD